MVDLLVYVVVHVSSDEDLERLREAVARPWLDTSRTLRGREARYYVPTTEAADNERAVLALLGLESYVELVSEHETVTKN